MTMHFQAHTATGLDHIAAASATTLIGVNSSGTYLDYFSIVGSANISSVFNVNTINIAAHPDYEELTFMASLSAQWTNMPAALTEFFGGTWARTQFNMTYVTSVRMVNVMAVAGSASSFISLQASTDLGVTWRFLGGATAPAVRADSAGGYIATSPWVAITAGYRKDMWLRVVGSSGDGATDPLFIKVAAQFY